MIITKYEYYGKIEGFITERTAIITNLYVKQEFRTKKLGTNLIKMFCEEVIKYGCVNIELDDMSNNQRQENNIYIKLGFKYKYKYGPEMVGNTRNIIKISSVVIKKNMYH